jgi:hypothetical protein
MRKPDLPSPLRDAAEALDRELERYAALAADLKREPATSEKSLRRSARILQGLAETEQLLGQHLGRLVAAIDARRTQQEATTAEVQRSRASSSRGRRSSPTCCSAATRWRRRRPRPARRCRRRAAGESEPEGNLAALEITAAGSTSSRAKPDAIGVAARDGDFADIARQTDGLKAQLTAAHRKLVATCERFRQGRVVH